MTVIEMRRPVPPVEPATAPRWVPRRAGILNVWRYYDEVLEFHEGRLLLRGPNGSGKSKALELLLPFLFDASLRANRLSTFGGNERSMHWNLMGEGASGTTRVGYVWLEFHLPGEHDRWFTCGARLQASTHTTAVHPDYFTTELRVGEPGGIELVNDAGQPLTRAVLEERLGDCGVVHATAHDHRTAVRTTLFPTLSEQRYDALITALLQLRTPKLSQRLDPAVLSSLLSAALPPLGQREISDLAEGFERLDAQRERLATLEEEVTATRTLAGRQRTYAQRVLRASSAALISATTELDNLTRAARLSAEEYERVAVLKEQAQERAADLDRETDAAEARRTGLSESEEYKKGLELDRLRERAAAALRRAVGIREDATRKRVDADTDAGRLRSAESVAQHRADTARSHEIDTGHAATRAGLAGVHSELGTDLDAQPAQARKFLHGAVRSRLDQIAAVGAALDTHDRAVDRREQAEQDLDVATTALGAATERLGTAVGLRDDAVTTLAAHVAEWAAGCQQLRFPDPQALTDRVESETALLAVVDSVATAALQEITRQETSHQAALDIARTERRELAEQERELAAERDLPPAAPPTRTTDRSAMAGAPLWKLIEFTDAVPDTAKAGIEAAVQAAGLLDAWVGPRGEIHGHDVFADGTTLTGIAGRSLTEVLVAAPVDDDRDPAVDPAAVQRLLAAVAFGDQLPAGAPAAIGADGSWRMGAVTGTWQKDHAAHIGALARRHARELRRRALQARIGELDATIAALDVELSRLAARRDLIATERAARPPHDELDAAILALTRAESDRDAADAVVRQRLETVTHREREVGNTLRVLTSLAAEHGTPTGRAALRLLAEAVRAFDEQAQAWLDAHGEFRAARDSAVAQAERATRSAAIAEQRAGEAAEAEREHSGLATMLNAIDGALLAEYREVLAEIEELRGRLRELRSAAQTTGREITTLAGRLGELSARRTTDAQVRDAAAARRDAASMRFRHLATGVLPADSGLPDLVRFDAVLAASDGVRAALDAARIVGAAWPTIPHAPTNLGDALHRLSESVHAVRTTLSARADLELETDEDVQIFIAIVDGVRVGAAQLLDILRSESEHARNEVTEHERDLFDQTLTGDTRRHLAARIRQANDLVDGMNARLEKVRTASKVAVRLVWQVSPDLPTGTKTARDLLLKDPARLSEQDRESLHWFFRERIEHAKADDTATSWEQQLAQVFDYRAWHRFIVKIDRANGEGWQPLTKKLHGALSGGEKAIALHLPLFAAVAAHYHVAPEAPRVILLDEVFVGVDSTNRGQVFALLSALELDLVLTSDHEWCTYSELSGIGIHQLITGNDGDDAVTTARFTWDGHDLLPGGSAVQDTP
jgi:uncharacterized protein (TIGR02680 family)